MTFSDVAGVDEAKQDFQEVGAGLLAACQDWEAWCWDGCVTGVDTAQQGAWQHVGF